MAEISVPEYYRRVNRDLLDIIPPDCKIVMEIGCGTGALYQQYRRINPGVVWKAIERNRNASAIAYKLGVKIVAENVERYYTLDESRETVDCLIWGDVLEHLQDPWRALKELTKLVRPGGQVLASIPNAGHWTVVRDLMAGVWQYQDEGLMDRTHLRWFTLQSARELFEQAGLEVFEVRGRKFDLDGAFQNWVAFVRNAPLHTIGIDREVLLKQSSVYQFLVRAIKPNRIPKPSIKSFVYAGIEIPIENAHVTLEIPRLHLHAATDPFGPACHRQRIHEPFRFLSTIPGVRTTTSSLADRGIETAIPYLPTDSPAVLILQRCQMPAAQYLAGIKAVRKQRPECLIVAEWDDSPEDFPNPVETDFLVFRAAHAVQVTTDVMAETVRQWNPNVMVVQNQIAELPEPRVYRDGHPTIFFGALNRKFEWLPIMPALNRVLRDHPDVWVQVVHDQEFYAALETQHKRYASFLEYSAYRESLRNCDIAILPLEPCRFCEHKSDLKFLEAAAEGVATVASETVYGRTTFSPNPHMNCIGVSEPKSVYENSGPLGGCYREPDAFEHILRALINKPDLRRKVVDRAYRYVRDHRLLKHHYREQYRQYRKLLGRQAALDREMLERVSELRI